MKKIVFVMAEEGIVGLVSIRTGYLLSRAISNLVEGRLDGIFIFSPDLKMSGAIENEYLKFISEDERKNVRLCNDQVGYGEAFCKFLMGQKTEEVGVFIYSTLSLKNVITENLNLCLEKLRDGVGKGDRVPLMFTN